MSHEPDAPTPRYTALAWTAVIGLGAAVWLAGAVHESQPAPGRGWRLLAVFLATVLALMLRPLPGGAAVLLGIVAVVLVGALPLDEALTGYSDPTVWLVLAAFLLARVFLKTGLARRIALTFVRLLGRNTLGLAYALAAADTVLAAMIPSNAARVGGVLLPITRSLAELYESRPGKTAGLLGTFLMLSLYQGDVVACALFFTGQAGNPLAAELIAERTGGVVILSYGTWFLYALAPAALSLLVVPLLVYRWERPALTKTPEAVEMARRELARMGPISRGEWILIVVFVSVVTGWVLLGARAQALAALAGPEVARRVVALVGRDATPLVALTGVAALFLTGLLTWEDAITEKAAWDVFIWYGGLIMLAKQLAQTKLLDQLTEGLADRLTGLHWLPLLVVTLIVYYYAHYAFASITAHQLAMLPAFVGVLLVAGAPPWVVACAFAYFANFAAGLTHYGTTPGPIIFGLGYVTQRDWWRVGFLLSLVNLAIWLIVGLAWWRLLGLWGR